MRKILLSLLLSLSGIALAQTPAPAPHSPDSPEELARQRELAQILRKQARQGREEAESIRENEYNACLAKILVNACRQEAREHYIERMKSVRAMEQEANTIDRIAKSKQAAQQDARIAENASAPSSSPSSPSSAPAVTSDGRTPPKPAPVTPAIRRHESDQAPAPSATGAAEAKEERARRESEAATEKNERGQEARERADQARKDAARYDANAKAIAEKKARRAAREASRPRSPGQSAPASAPR